MPKTIPARIDTATLNDLEVSRHDRGLLVAADVLRPLHQGVYHFTAVPLTLEGKALGACLANARAVVCSATAGRLWALRGIKDSPPYLHDGRLLTLEDTVEFFNLVLELRLEQQEKQDLVAFMRQL